MVIVVRKEEKKKVLLKEVGGVKVTQEKVVDGKKFYEMIVGNKERELISKYHHLEVRSYDKEVFVHDVNEAGQIQRTLYVRDLENLEWIDKEYHYLEVEKVWTFMFVKDIDSNGKTKRCYTFVLGKTKIDVTHAELKIKSYPGQILLLDEDNAGDIKDIYYLKCYEWKKVPNESQHNLTLEEVKNAVNVIANVEGTKLKLHSITTLAGK